MFYQLKAIRKGTKPPIWRRIVVPTNITFAQLAVILEAMLEFPLEDQYEIEFYKDRERYKEWQGEKPSKQDYPFFSYNASISYICVNLNLVKTFTLRKRGTDDLEYKIEVEGTLESVTKERDGKSVPVNYPCIIKQSSSKQDTHWSDPKELNKHLEQQFFLQDRPGEALTSQEIREKLEQHQGITNANNMDEVLAEVTEKLRAKLRELKAEAAELRTQNRKELEKNRQSQTKRKAPNTSMTSWLSFYEKEDLQDILEDAGLPYEGKRKDVLVKEVIRYLLDGKTIKSRLLFLDEAALDLFEKIVACSSEGKHYQPTSEEEHSIEQIDWQDYLITFKNGSVAVPDEVVTLYNTYKQNGYRQQHQRGRWLLQCVRVAEKIYFDPPVQVLYQMYCTSKTVRADHSEFMKLLQMITPEVGEYVIDGDHLTFRNIEPYDAYYRWKQRPDRAEYSIPSQREIEDLFHKQYPVSDKAYQRLRMFYLTEMQMSAHLADLWCAEIFQILASGGMPTDVMNLMNDVDLVFDTREQMERLVGLVVEASNQTRMPELSGRKPSEMRKTAIKKEPERRIYPNDPCPCGSGKKYKKCCGRGK